MTAWLAGDWHGAARASTTTSSSGPPTCSRCSSATNSTSSAATPRTFAIASGRSIGRIDPAHPHYGFVRGMYAFGLEESGDYELAEAHGLAAVGATPTTCGPPTPSCTSTRCAGGSTRDRFLRRHEADWTDGQPLHRAQLVAPRALPARGRHASTTPSPSTTPQIHHAASAGVPLEMLDASALLWRLLLDGEDTGGRFGDLADAWATRAEDAPWYAFNDVHAVMALVGAGRLDDASRVIERLDRYVAAGGGPRSPTWR